MSTPIGSNGAVIYWQLGEKKGNFKGIEGTCYPTWEVLRNFLIQAYRWSTKTKRRRLRRTDTPFIHLFIDSFIHSVIPVYLPFT